MTLKEATNLVGLAIANFPNMQEKDMRPTAKLWMQMLSDIPYSIAEKAILRSLSTAKFFPTVAEIREAAVLLTKPEIPTAIEAWGEVMNAIRRYGYYRPNEALASMTPITQSIVKKIGWREINKVWPTGLTEAESEELHRNLIQGTQFFGMIAALAHLLAYIYSPWLK